MSGLLVLGATGMLGTDVLAVADHRNISVVAPTRTACDLSDPGAVGRVLSDRRFDAVINCAAYTAVDDAEARVGEAYTLNTVGVAHLADACAQAGVPLVHVSTDYVFSGRPGGFLRGWRPDDLVAPVNTYGASKAAGEAELRSRHGDHHIVRTSWLAGTNGDSFITTMLNLAGRQASGELDQTLRVIDDQYGRLTTTRPLADRLLDLAGSSRWGTHHLTHTGPPTSWYELACVLFELCGLDVDIEPCPTSEFDRPATRPGWSVLNDSLQAVAPLPHWRDGLETLVAGLHAGGRINHTVDVTSHRYED